MRNSLLVLGFCFMSLNLFCQTKNMDPKHTDSMMAILNTPPAYPIKTIGIYVYDGYNTLDAIGPYQTLAQLAGVKIFMVAKEKGMIRNQTGLLIKVDTTIADVKQLDILVIPGGAKETYLQTKDTTLLSWIKRINQGSIFTTSVCTGAWILGATGLLNGKQVSANWYNAKEIMQGYGATYTANRYTRDGKYFTSAGVTAGIDMSLAIIKAVKGEKYAQAVMLDLEYDPHPPVKGGSVATTPTIVYDLMKTMYDGLFLELMKKSKGKL